jgi:hypothetical protein
LRELLDLCPLEDLTNLLDRFRCVLNPDVEDFITSLFV